MEDASWWATPWGTEMTDLRGDLGDKRRVSTKLCCRIVPDHVVLCIQIQPTPAPCPGSWARGGHTNSLPCLWLPGGFGNGRHSQEIRGVTKTEARCFFSALCLLRCPQDCMSQRLQPLSGGLACASFVPLGSGSTNASLAPEALQWCQLQLLGPQHPFLIPSTLATPHKQSLC